MENFKETEKEIIGKILILKEAFNEGDIVKKLSINADEFYIVMYEYNFLSGKIKWGGAIKEVLNQDSEEFIDVDIAKWKAMIHPEDLALLGNYPKIEIDKYRLFTLNYRLNTGNGEYINLKDVGIEFLNESDKPVSEFGIVYKLD